MKFDNKLDCIKCSMASPVFRFLKPDEANKINDNRIEVEYNAGETIIKQGIPQTHVISFYEGLAKISMKGSNGQNYILDFIRPQAFFSSPGLFVNNTYNFSVTSVEPCKLCLIEQPIFLDVMKSNPRMAFAFIENTNKFIMKLSNKMEGLLVKHQHGKMADALLYLAREVYLKNPFEITLSKKELSELTGISKESVSRILHEFSKEGFIKISGKHIHLLKISALKQISEKG